MQYGYTMSHIALGSLWVTSPPSPASKYYYEVVPHKLRCAHIYHTYYLPDYAYILSSTDNIKDGAYELM